MNTLDIREALHDFAATMDRAWKHDRSQSVGASEAFACIRRIAYGKLGVEQDPDYTDDYGARRRGGLIEDNFAAPAIIAFAKAHGLTAIGVGQDQITYGNGYLTATPDGLLVNDSDEAVEINGVVVPAGGCPYTRIRIERPARGSAWGNEQGPWAKD